MKKILTIIIVVLSVFLIYLGFKDNDIYYLSLGDSLALGTNSYGNKDYGYTDYVKEYLKEEELLEVYVDSLVKSNKRATDIIKEINDNVEVDVGGKSKTFQNVLIKADVITLSLGMNDLLDNVQLNNDFSVNDLYDKLDKVCVDFEELFRLLREYCKEEIVFIGLYNSMNNIELEEFIVNANKKLEKLANTYDIKYVNIYDEFKNLKYFPNSNNQYPSKEGYKIIADKIINIIKQKYD